MQVKDLLKRARALWPHAAKEQEIAVAMGVVYGDICRYVRDHHEGRAVDDQELKKELGNTIFSTIRWCDDLGFDVEECLRLAMTAQERYVSKN